MELGKNIPAIKAGSVLDAIALATPWISWVGTWRKALRVSASRQAMHAISISPTMMGGPDLREAATKANLG